MKVAVFGPSGMLGRQVVRVLADSGHVAQPVYRRMFELSNRDSVLRTTDGCDAIINCAGLIPTKTTSIIDMIHVNSIFPHILASVGQPTILVSTDCVFSGRNNHKYDVTAIKDPRDYYGMSKALGEALGPSTTIVRTSFIGCEHGFMYWIMGAGVVAKSLGARQTIEGWKNALWTGSTVQAVAEGLVALLQDQPIGIVHLSTEQVVNKFDLALKIIDMRQLELDVSPTYTPVLNRALKPTHVLAGIDDALAAYKCA